MQPTVIPPSGLAASACRLHERPAGGARHRGLPKEGVQRRQLETLEAVNDQLCEDHERMEQQLESVRSIVHN